MEENQNLQKASLARNINNSLFWILLGTTFLVPIFFLPATIFSTQFSTSLLFSFGVVLSIIIYSVCNFLLGSFDLPKQSKYFVVSISIIPLVYLLAGIANGFSRASFFGFTFDFHAVGFILLGFAYLFLVSVLFKQKERIFHSYFAFLISFVLLSLFVIIRMIFGADVFSFGIFTSITSTPVGSWNNLGIFFGIGLLLSLFTFEMVNVSRFMKVLLSIAILLSLFFLVLVNFNVIWIIVAICSFLFVVYEIFSFQGFSSEDSSFKDKIKKIRLYPLVVFIISLIFIFGGSWINPFISKTFKITNSEPKISFSDTIEVGRATLKERPLFGSGPNTFTLEWLKSKPDSVVGSTLWNTDPTNGSGLIPTFLVTTGIIGILSWFIFLAFYLYLGFKSIFYKFEDLFVKYLLTSSFFISLYLWIMAFVYVPSVVIFILTLFFTGLFFASIYLSGFIKVETRKFADGPRFGFISSIAFFAIFVASLSLAYGLFKNVRSLWYFQKSSTAVNIVGDIDASERLMIKATEVLPNDIYFRSLAEIELLKLSYIASQDTTKVSIEDVRKQFNDVLAKAITAAKSAQTSNPANYLNWLSLGRVYEAISVPELKIDGAYENAQIAYVEALKLNPKNPATLLFLARLAITHKDLNQARIYADMAIKMKSDYLDAHFLLSQIEVADNNLSAAIKSVTSASVIDPTNSATFFQLGLLKYNIKDFSGAINSLEKAIKISPDYANAKYFLGLSYESIGDRAKAIGLFEDIKLTNPDNQELDSILVNLKAGKPIFNNTTETKPEKGKTLPVKEKTQ